MKEKQLQITAILGGVLVCLVLLFATIQKPVIQQHHLPQYPPPPSAPPVPPEPKYLGQQQAVKTIKAVELKEWLYYLASPELDGRLPNTPGYKKAADYVEKHCKKWGLKTERQDVSVRGKNHDQNIFACIEGVEPDEVIVVGAHLDHLGNRHLGADDNGSGSVSVMAIAQAFSKMKKPRRTVLFQWYTAEESGLIGSRYYCDSPTFPKGNPSIKSHMAMINIDMVGRLGRHHRAWNQPQLTSTAPDIYAYVDRLNSKYSFAKRITQKGAGGSDHTPFLRKDIPAVFLHTGTHRDYHRPTDTVEKINYEGMEQIARYAFELARLCTESPDIQKVGVPVRRIPIYHDHMDGVPFPNSF